MAHKVNTDGIEFPDPQTDYHGHPHYGRVFVSLLILFAISLVVGFMFSPVLAITIIFLAALWKSALVVRNFMHLKYEPFLILIAVAAVIFCLAAFFWGVFPDITIVPREVTHL